MQKNNFNKAYIYIISIFAIGVAIANVISFFGGVGFAFVGSSVLLTLAISNILKSEDKKRFGDILALLVFEFIMLIILFFAYDFTINGISCKFPMIMRNIYSVYSIIAVAYVVFRFVSEIKGVKYNFVEYMLGNYTPQEKEPKVKKVKAKPSKEEIRRNKELENGTLEPKPSTVEVVLQAAEQSEEITTESSVETAKESESEQVVESENVDNTETVSSNEIASNEQNID